MPFRDDDPLALDPELMRQLGYATVDRLVARLSDDSIPPIRRASFGEMEQRIAGPAPSRPEPFEDILDRLDEDVLSFMSYNAHPAFFAFVPSCGTWPSALGDLIASACNIYAGSWMESPGPSRVEIEVLRWFAEWIGFPSTAGGVLTTGGSAANLTALACARESLSRDLSDDAVIYVSDQGHSSLARAARVLGLRPHQVRVLPTNSAFTLSPEKVSGAIASDLEAGRRPIFLSASAGATNSGSVDPLTDLHQVASENGMWFHVDAAYGGFSVLTQRGKAALRGVELADSVTLDPHKWLYQPFECGCLLVRDPDDLRRAFEITPDYLRDASIESAREVNFADLGVQLTRSSRALKVWISLRTFGLDAFRCAIDRSLDLAAHARDRIERSPHLELMAPPSLGIICFRRVFADTDNEEEIALRNARLVGALEASGRALVSSTRLHGTYAIRLCILNHTTGVEHVEDALTFLETHDVMTARATEPLDYERHPDLGRMLGGEHGERSPRSDPVSLYKLSPDDRRYIETRGSELSASGDRR
jgi:aromatic-L-amino-acid decarboxylase